jgi:hypothetical protein
MTPVVDGRDQPKVGHLYEINPIDFWHGWTTLEDYRAEYYKSLPNADIEPFNNYPEAVKFLEAAQRAAKQATNWEGDGYVYISAIPMYGDPSSGIIVAWKQSNNGTTFVASPVALPWMVQSEHDDYVQFYY